MQTPTEIGHPSQHGPPATQTSPLLKLPDELVLSIFSHISPAPRRSDHFARFRLQYGMLIDYEHQNWVRSLRPLSKTCRAMRLRLIPWIWERLELSVLELEGNIWKVLGFLLSDAYLAAAVRFLSVDFAFITVNIPLFVECLKALPYLHTLEVTKSDSRISYRLAGALSGVKLPKIKTLILHAPFYPLLRRCSEVEDVVCVVLRDGEHPAEFLESLPSKVRRLTIPLTGWYQPPQFVVMCPLLTELTVIYPLPGGIREAKHARTGMLEIINACEALPNFHTLQIVYMFESSRQSRRALSSHRGHHDGWDVWDELREIFLGEVEVVKDMAIGAFRRSECQEGGKESRGRRKKVALKFIELEWALSEGFGLGWGWPDAMILGSVKVDDYERK